MIIEIILIAAILGIFVLIVRRLPEALREGQLSTTPRSAKPVQTTPTKPNFFHRIFRQDEKSASTPTTALVKATPRPSSIDITDESILQEGDAYLEQGKFKEAERAYLRAVAKNPKNPKLYNRLGAIYLRARNYSDALQAFEAARDLDDTKSSRHYNVALAAWQLGNLAKARDAIGRAIGLDPETQKYRDLKTQIENGQGA